VPNGSYSVVSEADYHDTVLAAHNRKGDGLQINCGGPATATNGKVVAHVFKHWNGKKWV